MNDKHIWEGWTVSDFINELTPTFNLIQSGQSWVKKFEKTEAERLKKWCMENQSYVTEVFNHFKKQL